MTRYIISRLIGLVGVLVAISVITFLLMHAIPGNPFDIKLMERGILLPDAVKQELFKKYGLDRPIWEQYLRYVWNALHFDFGYAFVLTSEKVTALIGRTWLVSFHLGMMTLAVATVLGLSLGILGAIHQNTWSDHIVSLVSLTGFTVPNFVISVTLILIFAIFLRWLPTGGWDSPRNWVLPVLAYAAAPTAVVARFTRASVAETLNQDYVRTARSKGLRERRVILVHVLRNAMIPLLTIGGPIFTTLITGSLFIETIFRIPGLGQFFVKGILWRDYPVIMGTTLLLAALISLVNLVTDLLYVLVDPRIRLGQTERGR